MQSVFLKYTSTLLSPTLVWSFSPSPSSISPFHPLRPFPCMNFVVLSPSMLSVTGLVFDHLPSSVCVHVHFDILLCGLNLQDHLDFVFKRLSSVCVLVYLNILSLWPQLPDHLDHLAFVFLVFFLVVVLCSLASYPSLSIRPQQPAAELPTSPQFTAPGPTLPFHNRPWSQDCGSSLTMAATARVVKSPCCLVGAPSPVI